MFDKQDDSGVSPVIGVILMVAVTVALVALVTVTVFDLGGDVSESPDATVQLEVNGGNSSVDATLLRNENVQYLYLDDSNDNDDGDPGGTGSAELVSAGDTETTGDLTGAGSGTVNVIAVMPDGNQEVLTSTDYENQ